MEHSLQDTASDRGACEAGDRSLSSESPALDCFGPGGAPPPDEGASTLLESPLLHSTNSAESSVRASLPTSSSLPHTLTQTKNEDFRPPDTIASPTSTPSKAPFVRGHRRRSTHVTRRDLEKFRKEVLGIEPSAFSFDDEEVVVTANASFASRFEELNRAFEAAAMSLNSSAGNNPGSGMFSSYGDNSAGPSNLPGVPRQAIPTPIPHTPGQVNGTGMAGMNGGVPMNAGYQMDLRHLYDMVLELSDVLKNNRDMTKSIVSSAEELMKRASSEGTSPSIQQVNGEISGARIAELERALARERRLVEILKNEQAENTKLIGDYEAAVGNMVEQIRNYCHNNNLHYIAQKRHYNNLLQAERDAHLESRLDRDHWHAQTMKCADMIRTSYRLRCEEDELPIRIVAGLQNEVRAYRNALGMEPEKPEEEYGWEILRHVPGGSE